MSLLAWRFPPMMDVYSSSLLLRLLRVTLRKLPNASASAAAAPLCLFRFSRNRSRAAVRLEAIVRQFLLPVLVVEKPDR